MHALAPEEVVYSPGEEATQLFLPAAHDVQVEAPVAAEYLPAAHGVQLLDEEEEANDPAGHEDMFHFAFSAYTFPSYEPTKMLAPSGLTAGDESTEPPVANTHLCAPVAAFSARTGWLEPQEHTKMLAPSGLTAGDD